MSNYQKLYAFLPYFEKLSKDSTDGLVVEQNLFYSPYKNQLNDFVTCFYETNFTDTDYANTLKEHGITGVEEMAVQIPTADVNLLKAILTQMLREDRFSAGALGFYAQEGLIEKVLVRLGALQRYSS